MSAPGTYPQQQASYPQQQQGYPPQQGYPQQQAGYPQQPAGYQQQYPQPQPAPYGVPQQQAGIGQATTVYQVAHRTKKIWPNYHCNYSRTLGWIQIAVAFLSIIFNAVGIHMQKNRSSEEANGGFYASGGFWASIFYFISGGFAIGAAKHKTSCMIITNMVMSIISAIFGLGLLGTSASALGVENSSYYSWAPGDYTFIERTDNTEHKVSMAMAALMLVLSFIGIICAIWSSGICCAAVCCGRATRRDMTQDTSASTVQYTNPVPPITQQISTLCQQPPPPDQQPPPAGQQPPPAGQQPAGQPAGQQPAGQQGGYGYNMPPPAAINPTYQAGGYGAAPPPEPELPPSYEATVGSNEKTPL